MPKIIALPESTVSRIAAGEVIERPAYAVKELIENAIDAGSTTIEVHIEDAGLRRITIIDNGEGMSSEDLVLSFLPHTTSKLREGHELIGIKTLGFRGEALASIAAISTLTLRSRTPLEPGGTEVIIRNGQVENIAPVGTPPGTIVTVDNLFLNVPARKKFLKSEKTEFRLITDIVTHFALSYPHIHFLLTHNKRSIFDLPTKLDMIERIKSLLGVSAFEHLVPVSYEEGYINLSGFIGKPQIASKQNQKQFLFVNHRFVTDRLVSLAIKEAFGTLLPAVNTPIFVLHLSLPPEMVDVNVHPRKEQIALLSANSVFDAIKLAVSQTLSNHNLTFQLVKFKQETSARIGETTSSSGRLIKDNVLPWDRTLINNSSFTRNLYQLHQTYIIKQTKEGMTLYDQHAAEERVLFEKFHAVFLEQKKKKVFYELPSPITLELSVSETQLMEEYRELFMDLGFTPEHFQGTSFILRSIPLIFKGRNNEKIIKEMLVDLLDDTIRDIDTTTQRMLAYLACRAAVKSGDLLSDEKMADILQQLDQSINNATCPHGRPTQIVVTIDELNKLFKR